MRGVPMGSAAYGVPQSLTGRSGFNPITSTSGYGAAQPMSTRANPGFNSMPMSSMFGPTSRQRMANVMTVPPQSQFGGVAVMTPSAATSSPAGDTLVYERTTQHPARVVGLATRLVTSPIYTTATTTAVGPMGTPVLTGSPAAQRVLGSTAYTRPNTVVSYPQTGNTYNVRNPAQPYSPTMSMLAPARGGFTSVPASGFPLGTPVGTTAGAYSAAQGAVVNTPVVAAQQLAVPVATGTAQILRHEHTAAPVTPAHTGASGVEHHQTAPHPNGIPKRNLDEGHGSDAPVTESHTTESSVGIPPRYPHTNDHSGHEEQHRHEVAAEKVAEGVKARKYRYNPANIQDAPVTPKNRLLRAGDA
eukprot:GFYU01012369.1.p1 GENE.GFYU01012369.1~~GFYU01012369.1.p1  ORF type:complete len:394 (+),score=58.53 GFYU01012369.1:107-1183(+)